MDHSSGEVPERAKRRTFTAAYKLKIVEEYEAATPSRQLSGEASGYICGALLEWVLLGEPWPRDPVEPIAGPDCDHLEALLQITNRWAARSVAADPVSRRFEMAIVGRELTQAIRCQSDPQGLAESIEREMVHRMPWLATCRRRCCSLMAMAACCELLGT